jgi:hypothetical protein
MTSTVEIGKLAQLREKTDRDLVKVIRKELERGLILASVATTRQSPLYSRAEMLHGEAAALLAKVYGLSEAERTALEGRLLELRKALDHAQGRITQRQAGS